MSAAAVATLKDENTRLGAFEIPSASLARGLHACRQAEVIRDPNLPEHRVTFSWPRLRRAPGAPVTESEAAQ